MDGVFGVNNLVSLVLGVLLGTWFSHFLKRPKLVLNGGGGGGAGNGVIINYVTVQNAPGLFGIDVRPTVLFGWKVFNGDTFGFSIDRSSARDCSAWLLDPETKEKLTGLFWRVNGEVKSYTDIGPGEVVDLILFGKIGSNPSAYFALSTYDANGFAVPPPSAYLSDSRKFLVEIVYSPSRKMRFKVEVKRGLDGRLSCYTPMGGGTF